MKLKRLSAFLTVVSMTFGLMPSTAVQASAEDISSIELETVSNRNFYFSHDFTSFDPAGLIDLSKTYATDKNGNVVALDATKFTFGIPEKGEIIDLSPKEIYEEYQEPYTKVSLLVFYDGVRLGDTIDVYIGVKGDANLDGSANAEDAANVLNYAARMGSGEESYIFSSKDDTLDSFAYFLADVTDESKDRGIHSGISSVGVAGSRLDALDAADILVYAAEYGANGSCDWIPTVLFYEPYPDYSRMIAENAGLIDSASEPTRYFPSVRSAQNIKAQAFEPINVTIDQKTVTVEEAKKGVPIYVRVDNAVLNAIEFGVHVDDRANYEVVGVPNQAVRLGGELLDIYMTYRESRVESNMVWCTFASNTPDSDMIAAMENGERDCMNLIMLNVTIPDPVPDEVYNIEYLSAGVTSHSGDCSTEIWCNTFAGTNYEGDTFDVIDYVALGTVSVTDGWIEIQSDSTTPATKSNKKGDIDGDGTISIVDVLTLNQYLLGIGDDVSTEGIAAADVDGDKLVTDADAMMILKSLVGLATISE